MIKLIAVAFFLFSFGTALAANREFGHPLFRTFNAHDYGDAYEIYAVTEDQEGRMLFGCQDAILAFDNNRWETIPAPETGYIRWLAVDSQRLSLGSGSSAPNRLPGQNRWQISFS